MGQFISNLQYHGPVTVPAINCLWYKLRGKTRAQEVEVLEQAARDLNGLINQKIRF
jgi:hypothetical protein